MTQSDEDEGLAHDDGGTYRSKRAMTQAASRPHLSRGALRRVLRSLLTAELAAARGRAGRQVMVPFSSLADWPDDLRIMGEGAYSLGCDSLDVMALAAATNEMFHLHEAGHETDLLVTETFGAWIDHIEAAWRGGVVHVTFTTSGSTGLPKRCAHGLSHLDIEIDHLAQRFGGIRRVVALAPAHHIYGFLFTALLPQRLGIDVLPPEAATAGRLGHALRDADLVVSFPERWRWLDRTLPGWPPGVSGVVSTAPCPPDLIASLVGRGLGGMTEVYGSSETCGVALREWPEPAYRLMPQWVFVEESEPDRPLLEHRSGARMPLMDRVETCGDGMFRLAGRLDGMVQVGGTNVQPRWVAERLRGRPGVGDAEVRLMRPDEGTRLKAYIVPVPNADVEALGRDLRGWIETRLPAAERPTSLTFGWKLPTGSLGKTTDW